MSAKVQHTFTVAELDEICDHARQGRPVDAIVAAWVMLVPDFLTNEPKSINPRDYSIPSDQWRAIGDALASPGGELGAAALLEWVNIGPSSTEDPA